MRSVSRSIIRYAVIIFGIAAFYASTNRNVMARLSAARNTGAWWGSYQITHGDLTALAYLDFVKAFSPTVHRHIEVPDYNGPRNTVLYMCGDSYTVHMVDSEFAGICQYHYISRYRGGGYFMDTSKKTVLVLEISERMARKYFATTRLTRELKDSVGGAAKTSTCLPLPAPATQYAGMLPHLNEKDFFNPNVNQNLQFNLFNYNFLMPMFESKAALNYYLFNRASGDVVISEDGKYVFMKETVAATGPGSCYVPVDDTEIEHMVTNLNAIYDHFRAAGFHEVYLSVIPNAATILQPEGYNNLIPRIQNNPRLRMKTIDIYTLFRASKNMLYRAGDTHWNYEGKQMWLNLLNERLEHG